MKGLLDDLNSLPGVTGGMFCTSQGEVLARSFPSDFDDASLAAVASTLAASAAPLRSLTGAIGVVDLRFREARVVIRPAGSAFLVILCSKATSAQELMAFASVACKKFERLSGGTASGRGSSPAVPTLSGGGTAPGSPAAEVASPGPPTALGAPAPAAAPLLSAAAASPAAARAPSFEAARRRTALFVFPVAAAVLALAIVGGQAYLRRGERRPPSTPKVEAIPGPSAPPSERPPAAPAQTRLRLSGAETLATELMPALATAYLASKKATDVEVTHPGPDEVVVRGVLTDGPVGVEIRTGSTAQGLEDLLAGKTDVALASRRIRFEEAQKLSSIGAMTSPSSEHVLGVDGIMVVVNRANPVPALSREQLGAVLSGAVADWSRLSSGGGEIHVYLPDDRSGIPEVAQALLLGSKPFTPRARRLPAPWEVADAVSIDPVGIGLVPMAAAAAARIVPVGGAKEGPRVPTALTIASEEYPLCRRLYLYTAETSASPQVKQFLEFALSAEGEALLRKAGFVPLGAGPEPRAPSTGTVGVDVGPTVPRAAEARAPDARRTPAPSRADAGRLPPAGSPAQPAPARQPELEPPRAAEGEAGAPGLAEVPSPRPPPPEPPPANLAVAPPPSAPAVPAVEDAPVYATNSYRKPKLVEAGCVQRELRVPLEVLDRIGAKPITVKFAVGRDGKPGRFQVLTPGLPTAGGSAIWSAIQACRWTPGTDEAGEPADIWMIMPFRFARD
ncbi:MAG TPA: substrate-binding domain-containing protein [Anaeromyxobacter sp.]|nr:substrate-binding domain-containing protein [Anaeromyxobacter sp.]